MEENNTGAALAEETSVQKTSDTSLSVLERETRLKDVVGILAVLLVVALVFGGWCFQQQKQANQMLGRLMEDAQELLQENQKVIAELEEVQTKLDEKTAENEQIFNTLYPAYVAVTNIRYIGKDTQEYHCYDCSIFGLYDSYTAHNTEYCQLMGYTPCPVCCP